MLPSNEQFLPLSSPQLSEYKEKKAWDTKTKSNQKNKKLKKKKKSVKQNSEEKVIFISLLNPQMFWNDS